ncbi:MAG: heptosyltransferase [Comamonadaceae bacterium]|nr:MAG: heptosyltransferase [Comamonadaceae bacterium]
MSAPTYALYIRLPNWIGDVCMALPVLHALCAPGRKVYICARPWAKDLLAGVPAAGFIALSGKFLTDRATVAAHRRAQGMPARGLLLPDSLSSAAVFRLAGVRAAGWRDDGRSALLAWPFTKPTEPLHAVQAWYRLATLAQAAWNEPPLPPAAPKALDLPITVGHTLDAQAAMVQHGLSDQSFILIAPTATGLHKGRVKVWPHYAELTQALIEAGHRVVYCVPAAELSQARANAPQAEALAPMGLGAFAALTRHARLVICNDSGVSHLAAAAGARQITLFGVTSAARTGPWSSHAICLGEDNAWPELDAVLQCVQFALQSDN